MKISAYTRSSTFSTSAPVGWRSRGPRLVGARS
jgi:hypothetical protein